MKHLTLKTEQNRLLSEGYKFMPQHPMHEPCKAMEKEESYGVSVVMLHSRINCPHDITHGNDGSITIIVKPEIRSRYA
jgi:hypothetical protein